MKTTIQLIKTGIIICFASTLLISCDKGKKPNISFKAGSSYISGDASVTKKASFTIGIDASKSESEDVLKKFNISKSVNGGSDATIYSQDLSGSDGNNFSYDYTANMDTIVGQKNHYTFTVTNRDGLINQVDLTITVK